MHKYRLVQTAIDEQHFSRTCGAVTTRQVYHALRCILQYSNSFSVSIPSAQYLRSCLIFFSNCIGPLNWNPLPAAILSSLVISRFTLLRGFRLLYFIVKPVSHAPEHTQIGQRFLNQWPHSLSSPYHSRTYTCCKIIG